MKKKIFLLISLILLAGCELTPGIDAQQCDDNVASFPDENFTYGKKNLNIRNSYAYELDNPIYNHERENESAKKDYFENSDKKIIPDYSFMDNTLKHGNDNILLYAQNTALQNEANLPLTTRYPKIFDGQISCAGKNANSRLGLYSNGVIVELGRKLQTASGIALYMTHNFLTLKMKVFFILYKPTDSFEVNEYDEFVFSFYTNLGTSVAGPKFFYLDLTKILDDTSVLTGCNMLGLRYERIDLSDEEKNDPSISESFAEFYDNLEDEKNHTKSKDESFLKLYDIGIPYSTWAQ